MRSKEALVAKGIEQAWRRRHRLSYNIHSGVRVKVRQKTSSSIELIQQQNYHQPKTSSFDDQTNRMQSMLKRLWIESETSALTQNGQNSITITKPSSLKRIRNPSQDISLISSQRQPSFLQENHGFQLSSNIQKEKNMNSIGIQTTKISRMNRQTSCDMIMPRSMMIKKYQKKRSSSSSSNSETSISKDIENENSTHTDSTSTESSSANSSISTRSENDNNYSRYRRNKNRNNNAIDTNVERTNNYIMIEDFKLEKSIAQLSNNEQPLQEINIKPLGYPQLTTSSVSSTEKKGFFGTFLHLFSLFRLSSSKHARIPISTGPIGSQIAADTGHNGWNRTIRPPTSRCRRSAARNYNQSSSIQPERNFFQLKSEEDRSSNLNYFQQKPSVHSISDVSLSCRKQTNNSSLSIIQKTVPHRSKKNQRHSFRRKKNHKNRRKHLRISNNSSHSQSSSSQQKALSTATVISPSSENVILPKCSKIILPPAKPSSVDEEIKVLIEESIENNVSRRLPRQEEDLSIKSINTKPVPYVTMNSINKSNTLQKMSNDDKKCYSIRLRVKNKNLLSKSKIPPPSSIYHVDDSIQYHQRNIVNEFKSILQQTKNIHINNNASDDDPTVLKRDTNEILTSSKSNVEPTVFSIKNQNENKHQRASILSSDTQSITTEDTPMNMHKLLQGQNEIIQDGIDQLKRYQKFAENYKLKSNKPVKQFLMKSIALSSESLYKLSIDKESNPTFKIKKKT